MDKRGEFMLRNLIPVILMISMVGIVMSQNVGDLQSHYGFNTSENFEATYSKMSALEARSNTLEGNVGDSDLELSTESDLAPLELIGNVLSIIKSSITYVTSPTDGIVASAANDLGLPAWVSTMVIIIIVGSIVMMLAGLFLRGTP